MVVLEKEQVSVEEVEVDFEFDPVVVVVDLAVVVVLVSSAAKTPLAKMANKVTKLNFILAISELILW